MTPRAPRATTFFRSVVVRLVVLSVALAAASGCAGSRFVRPAGAAVPFPEGAGIWATLSSPCRAVSSGRIQLRVSGRVNDQGFPALTTGLAVEADRLSLVAMAGSRRVFNLAGEREAVVLLNHLEATMTRGVAADVIDALVGVRLTPARLLAVLTGCVSADASVIGADRVGAMARIRTPDSLIYLVERGGQWQLAGAEFGDVVADYRHVEGGWPREIELQRGRGVRLRLRVIEFERDPRVPPAVFQLTVPESYVEIPVDELRRNGPLAGREP